MTQLRPSKIERDVAEETATFVPPLRTLGSLPPPCPAPVARLPAHTQRPPEPPAHTELVSAGGLTGWRTPNIACVLCGGGGREDPEHLLTQCPVTDAALAMLAQHSPATRKYVTHGANADSFIFRTDLPPDALLALLCLSRAVWQTRKARVSSAPTRKSSPP